MGKAGKEEVRCRFCGGEDGDGHLFWDCTFPPSSMFGDSPSSCPSWLGIEVSDPGAYVGMAGCLVSVLLVS